MKKKKTAPARKKQKRPINLDDLEIHVVWQAGEETVWEIINIKTEEIVKPTKKLKFHILNELLSFK